MDSRKRAGITFLELILVIAIIAVFAAITLPNFRKTFYNHQLKSFSRGLQAMINYLHERSIVERKVIYLAIDNANQEYRAEVMDNGARVVQKKYPIPQGISIECVQQEILIYPDGSLDKVDLLLKSGEAQVQLTTKGVFGGAKVQEE